MATTNHIFAHDSAGLKMETKKRTKSENPQSGHLPVTFFEGHHTTTDDPIYEPDQRRAQDIAEFEAWWITCNEAGEEDGPLFMLLCKCWLASRGHKS